MSLSYNFSVMEKLILLIISGALGTLSRYAVSSMIGQSFESRFPWGTFVINVLGCFFIGFFAAMSESRFPLSANMRLFIMVGFLGAFTTFSTFMLETATLIKGEVLILAFANVFASLVVGWLLFRLGMFLATLM